MEDIAYPIRINRYLALNNYCSRREADALIVKKIVTINGKTAVLGDRVNEGDLIEVNIVEKKKFKEYRYFAYNKPKGIVTHKTEDDQKEILESIDLPQGVFPVGRLDRQSHGLILLTNDGRVNDKLLNPDYDHEKEYLVRVAKPITNIFLKIMTNGVQLEDFKTKPCIVKKVSDYEFKIILTEGKKHQIRRMCDNIGFGAMDLKRVRIMNIDLSNLGAGHKREIIGKELDVFLRSIGINN
jgi:23S rRNA pseudouridine2604 synthase